MSTSSLAYSSIGLAALVALLSLVLRDRQSQSCWDWRRLALPLIAGFLLALLALPTAEPWSTGGGCLWGIAIGLGVLTAGWVITAAGGSAAGLAAVAAAGISVASLLHPSQVQYVALGLLAAAAGPGLLYPQVERSDEQKESHAGGGILALLLCAGSAALYLSVFHNHSLPGRPWVAVPGLTLAALSTGWLGIQASAEARSRFHPWIAEAGTQALWAIPVALAWIYITPSEVHDGGRLLFLLAGAVVLVLLLQWAPPGADGRDEVGALHLTLLLALTGSAAFAFRTLHGLGVALLIVLALAGAAATIGGTRRKAAAVDAAALLLPLLLFRIFVERSEPFRAPPLDYFYFFAAASAGIGIPVLAGSGFRRTFARPAMILGAWVALAALSPAVVLAAFDIRVTGGFLLGLAGGTVAAWCARADSPLPVWTLSVSAMAAASLMLPLVASLTPETRLVRLVVLLAAVALAAAVIHLLPRLSRPAASAVELPEAAA